MLRVQSSRDFLQIIFRYKRAAKNSALVVALMMLIGMLIKSPNFTSDAKLFIHLGKENQALPAAVKAPGDVIPATPSRDQLLDEKKILLGDNVVTSVAEYFLLVMESQPEPEGLWGQVKLEFKKSMADAMELVKEVLTTVGLRDARAPVDSLKQALLKHFEISHDPGSAVIDVAFTWKDPHVAHKVLEFWIESYLSERDKLQGYNSRLLFYMSQVDGFKQKIKKSQFELQSYLIDADSSNINMKMEAISQKLVDIADRKYLAQSELSAILSGISATDSRMGGLDRRHLSEELKVLNPVKMDLTERLNTLIVERERSLAVFNPSSSRIKSLDQGIAAIQARINQEPDKIIGEQLTNNNPSYMSLESGVHQRTIQAEELKAKIEEYDRQSAELRGKLKGLVEQSVYVGLLETDIQKYQDEYKNYKSGLEKAKLEQSLELNQISNVKIMQQPSYNPVRTSMKPLLNIMLIPIFGIISALLVCYLLALLDRRIFDKSSIGAKDDIHIIDVIPFKELDGCENYRVSVFRLASAIGHLVKNDKATIAVTTLANPISSELLADIDQARVAIGGGYECIDGQSLANSVESYPRISEADYVLIAAESGKATLPQLHGQLKALRMSFPDKVLGVLLFNRQYEIPDKIFSWMNH